MFEWTIDGRDPTRGNAHIACRRLQLRMPEKGLDVTNIYPAIEQFCREAALVSLVCEFGYGREAHDAGLR
jgi:hypothetical protein